MLKASTRRKHTSFSISRATSYCLPFRRQISPISSPTLARWLAAARTKRERERKKSPRLTFISPFPWCARLSASRRHQLGARAPPKKNESRIYPGGTKRRIFFPERRPPSLWKRGQSAEPNEKSRGRLEIVPGLLSRGTRDREQLSWFRFFLSR